MYSKLFWKKAILRDGLAADVPERFRWQKKIPFFCGVDARFTTRMLMDLVLADGQALVHEALGDPDKHHVLAPGLVKALIADGERDPGANIVEDLLMLINLGLLEQMAREAPRFAAQAEAPVVEVATWTESEAEALLADGRVDIDFGRALALGPGIELARPLTDDNVLWISVYDKVQYIVDGEETAGWRAVLARVDGARPLQAILDEVGLRPEAVRKLLEEALEFGVVRWA
jgi:hypothetical protein